MSHVDEGTINAWLDGAFEPDDPVHAQIAEHIAGCEACSRLVETERQIRDRAAYVLDQAAPDAVRVVPFETVLAGRRSDRAGAAAPATDTPQPDIAPRRSFRIPLAAAATVLLAATATVFARQYMPRPDLAPRTATEADAVGEPPANAPVSAPPPVLGEAAPSAARKSLADQAAGTDDQAQRRSEVAGDQRQRDSTARLRSNAIAEPPVVASTETLERGARETRRIDSLLRNQAIALDEVVVTGVAVSVDLAATESDPFAQRVLASARSLAWDTIAPPVAASRLGRMPATVRGFGIDSIHAATLDGRSLVRVMQNVDSAMIELIEWSAAPAAASDRAEQGRAAAPPAARAADAAKTEKEVVAYSSLVARIPGLTVLLRAVLPADSLAVLGRSIR